MRLYLVRHGDAIHDASAGYRSDAERWLTDRGREEVGWTAQLLERLGVRPDLILSSPLVRARQTAEIIAGAFDPQPPLEFSDHLVHGGSFAGILHDLQQHGSLNDVVLTGHMPSIGELVGWLCWNDRASAVQMRTAAVARVDLPDDRIAPGWGDLRWLFPPKAARRLVGS